MVNIVFSHSPITNPYKVLDWLLDRLQPFLNILIKKCFKHTGNRRRGYGVSTWIIQDKFKEATGLDISKNAIDTANKLFPEINFVQSDVSEYFKKSNKNLM